MQFDVRRRLSRGLSANANYQYAPRQGMATFDGFSLGRQMIQNTQKFLRHSIKVQPDWTIPVGTGASRQTLLLAPWFKRFDPGATKRFDLVGSTNVEVRFDVLNCSTRRTSPRWPIPAPVRASSERPARTRMRATPTIRVAASGS